MCEVTFHFDFSLIKALHQIRFVKRNRVLFESAFTQEQRNNLSYSSCDPTGQYLEEVRATNQIIDIQIYQNQMPMLGIIVYVILR